MNGFQIIYDKINEIASKNDSFIKAVWKSKDSKSYWFSTKMNRYKDSTSGNPEIACKAYKYNIETGKVDECKILDLINADLSDDEIDLSIFSK